MQEPVSHQASRPLWKNIDYLLLWSGQAISSLGTGITLFAFPLLILTITHSFAAAGFAGALGQLPYLLFSLPAGALVDRWNRKHVMLVSALGLALCVASIPFAILIRHLTLLQLYLVSFAIGVLYVFYELAGLAALTHVVRRDQLAAAVSQNEAVYSIVSLLAPPLGGTLLSIGLQFPFIADACSYLVLLGSLFGIRASFQEERKQAHKHVLAEIREGIARLWSHHLVRLFALLTAYLYVLMSGGVLIVYAISRQQHISSVIIGLLLGIGGIGNIAGTLLCPLVQQRVSFGRALCGSLVLFVVLWPLYALSDSALLLGVVIVGLALLDSVSSILLASYRLAAVPDEMQGRISSIYRLVIYGALALGQVLIGQCLDRFGVLLTVGLLWLGLLLFTVVLLVDHQVRQATFPRDEHYTS